MIRRITTAVACLLLLNCAASAAEPTRPNLVFILADDLGWGDLGCYGNPFIKTPNLDRLARQGTLFTHFYVTGSVCSPSRCGFLTGQYPARHRIHGHYAAPELNARRGMSQWLDPKVVTLPRLLKTAGYATAHVGKWHLGGGDGGKAPEPSGLRVRLRQGDHLPQPHLGGGRGRRPLLPREVYRPVRRRGGQVCRGEPGPAVLPPALDAGPARHVEPDAGTARGVLGPRAGRPGLPAQGGPADLLRLGHGPRHAGRPPAGEAR